MFSLSPEKFLQEVPHVQESLMFLQTLEVFEKFWLPILKRQFDIWGKSAYLLLCREVDEKINKSEVGLA